MYETDSPLTPGQGASYPLQKSDVKLLLLPLILADNDLRLVTLPHNPKNKKYHRPTLVNPTRLSDGALLPPYAGPVINFANR